MMRPENFGMGFFGRMPFGTDERKEMFDKWSTMSDEEKVTFMNKRMEAMNGGEHGTNGFGGKREFTVESMDKRCEEWMGKTPEEKEAFVNERNEAMKHFFEHGAHFFAHHGRGFGFGFPGHEHCASGEKQ